MLEDVRKFINKTNEDDSNFWDIYQDYIAQVENEILNNEVDIRTRSVTNLNEIELLINKIYGEIL